MNVIDALNTRKSIRAFKPDPVDQETLRQILAAANRAPSWADTQPWEIFVAGGEVLSGLRKAFLARHEEGVPSQTDLARPQDWPPALQQRMAENNALRFAAMGVERNDEQARQANVRRNYEFFNAPLVVYLCMDRTLTPWSIFDVGMMAQSIMLAAQEFGVGSIPAINLVAYPDLIRRELAIPEEMMILIGLAMGYEDPAEPLNKIRSLRRPLDSVVRVNGL